MSGSDTPDPVLREFDQLFDPTGINANPLYELENFMGCRGRICPYGVVDHLVYLFCAAQEEPRIWRSMDPYLRELLGLLPAHIPKCETCSDLSKVYEDAKTVLFEK